MFNIDQRKSTGFFGVLDVARRYLILIYGMTILGVMITVAVYR